MTSTTTRPTVLALVLPADRGTVASATDGSALLPDGVPRLLETLRERKVDATILSLSVEGMDERLAERIAAEASSGTLMLSAAAVTLDRALAAERIGAAGLLREPLDAAEIASFLNAASNEGKVLPFVETPARDAPDTPPLLVGESPAMAAALTQLARVASSETTVLVTGESGTGKEVVARSLHWASKRRDGPFVAVNCAAIPEHLLESELFGHERGAFTGAVARRTGRFERADGGTLFLDEIGDMSLVLQAKILRVLEERHVEPVGAHEGRPIDVRVVAATNRSLTELVATGAFREDLYYRLAVVDIALPALRDRGGDIDRLALHFGAHFARAHRRDLRGITEEALRRLRGAHWPGTVRELRNVMDRAVLLADGGVIRSRDIRVGAGAPVASAARIGPTEVGYDVTRSLEEVEADHIRRVLAAVDGHMGEAARILGIHRNTLTRKVQAYGLLGSDR